MNINLEGKRNILLIHFLVIESFKGPEFRRKEGYVEKEHFKLLSKIIQKTHCESRWSPNLKELKRHINSLKP